MMHTHLQPNAAKGGAVHSAAPLHHACVREAALQDVPVIIRPSFPLLHRHHSDLYLLACVL